MACFSNILFILLVLIAIKMILVAIFFHHEIIEAQKKDPAAKSFIEVLLLYQGLHALVSYRVANYFYRMRLFFIVNWFLTRRDS